MRKPSKWTRESTQGKGDQKLVSIRTLQLGCNSTLTIVVKSCSSVTFLSPSWKSTSSFLFLFHRFLLHSKISLSTQKNSIFIRIFLFIYTKISFSTDIKQNFTFFQNGTIIFLILLCLNKKSGKISNFEKWNMEVK